MNAVAPVPDEYIVQAICVELSEPEPDLIDHGDADG